MDFHFLVRNGIAGGIFVALFFVGIWVVCPGDALTFMRSLSKLQSLTVAGVAAGTPVIGICLQSLVLAYRYSRQKMFTDTARGLVARRFRQAIRSNPQWKTSFAHLLNPDTDDRLFVSIYHRHALPHLIEWARRRRSFSYLGETCMCAVLLGTVCGVLFSVLQHSPMWNLTLARAFIVAIAIVVCISFALPLSRRMRHDADEMELAWVIYELMPDFRQEFANDLANQVSAEQTFAPARDIILHLVERLFGQEGR